MPHPKPLDEEDVGGKDHDGDDEVPGSARSAPKTPTGKRSSPRKRATKKVVAHDQDDMDDFEADLIKTAETAVLDCILDRLEEKQRAGKGGYRGYSKKLVNVLAPRHPWLTAGMVAAHRAKRQRQTRKKKPPEEEEEAEEESPRPRKRGRTKKSEGMATEAVTPRKRGRSSKSDKAESTKKAAAEKVAVEDEAEAEEDTDGVGVVLKDPPKEDGSGSTEKDGDGEADEEDITPKQRDPGGRARWRNPGGRPTGTSTKQRPRGSRILTPEQKYDQTKHKQARDYAALEYHKIRHTSENKRLKKGVLESIIADAKKRFGLPDDYKMAHSTILGRVKRGVLIATGTKSPMERVEEELVHLCNDQLKDMNRQLFAHEGTELANSLIKKYEMEGEIREWKLKHSYVATEADGKTPVAEKACYMGKAYWNQFIKRHGHRLEVRKVGRVGPQTPMVQVEDDLVEIVNGLGRQVRPSEGVRLALSLIEGTSVEMELRDFKVRVLKNKTAENKKGELLGPGYWRAFIRRNKQSLLYLDAKKDEATDGDAGVVVPTDSFEEPRMAHPAATSELRHSAAAAEEADSQAAVHVDESHDIEPQEANAYVAQAAPTPAVAAVETYNPHAAHAAAPMGEDNTHYAQPHQWYSHMHRGHMM